MLWVLAPGVTMIGLSVGFTEIAARSESGWLRELTRQVGLFFRALGVLSLIVPIAFLIFLIATDNIS